VSLLESLLDIGESVPGWTVIVLTGILVALLIGGRILDIMDTTVTGVESKIRNVTVDVENNTLGAFMPDYGYKTLARGVWATVTSILAIVVTLFWISKAVNALRRGGEEL
jgi:hypothetical protein